MSGYGIIDLAKDMLAGEVEKAPPSLIERRIALCNGCEHLGLLRNCKICNCFVDYKTTLLKAECPIQKW